MANANETSNHTNVDTGPPPKAPYFAVAMLLVVLTAIEVGSFYVESLGHGIIPILAILSGAKFALVVMFYMHLRYDAKLLTWLFLAGFFLAITVVFALLGLFHFFI